MANALGIIVDENPNHNAVDVWALVLNNIVVNTILATYNQILAISPNYDYCVDVTMQGESFCSIGCTYNAGQNLFIAPPAPPINYVENVRAEYNEIISVLQQTLLDAGVQGGSLDNTQLQSAYNSAINDNPGMSVNLSNLLATIHQFVLSGG